jgi:hypothetical protein
VPDTEAQDAEAREGLRAYRRIAPFQWDGRADRPQPAAFRRKATEEGLSLYRADLRAPRAVLELMLAGQQARARSADEAERERAARWLSQNGDTPELLWDRGWRIARVDLAEFTSRGFQVGLPDAEGHIDVTGPLELFQLHSLHFAAACEVLSRVECLE